jgi:hypothetical protein
MKTNIILQIATIICVAVFSVSLVRGASLPMKDPTTPIVLAPLPGMAEGTPRTLSNVRIEAAFDWGFSTVEVRLQNAGTSVVVDIENTTTGTSYEYLVSGDGSDSLPINSTPGFWTITFTLSDGSVYFGAFTL